MIDYDIHIANGLVVNEGSVEKKDLYIKDGRIKKIIPTTHGDTFRSKKTIDANGKHVFPGVIDDQVHFREPGLTSKADIYTESKAAVAGGTTSFMEMPNTIPQAVSQEELSKKFDLAKEKSLANYSFYIGATNNNLEELLASDPAKVCGIKIFMGSSTGNMLVADIKALEEIFSHAHIPIATHCEDEAIIRENTAIFRQKYGENMPMKYHPRLRSEEACYRSSSLAAELSAKHGTRLHILHISTAKELSLFTKGEDAKKKLLTGEACVHHLLFDESDYEQHGSRIKWNPAVKTAKDKLALREAVEINLLDVIATDHAPHTKKEKDNNYFNCPSGGPLVQHSLVAMLELYHEGVFSLAKLVHKMCHVPADIFSIHERGYIREGYHADLAIVDLNAPWTVTEDNILYKCKWSPFENKTFRSKVNYTLVNGHIVYKNGIFNENTKGHQLLFNR